MHSPKYHTVAMVGTNDANVWIGFDLGSGTQAHANWVEKTLEQHDGCLVSAECTRQRGSHVLPGRMDGTQRHPTVAVRFA
jgi:hypothetical protein